MADYKFRITPLPISENPAFAEASADELRVLVAIMDKGGAFSEEDIIDAAKVSRARFSAAVALWQGSGVLLSAENGENFLTYEFEDRLLADDFVEEGAVKIAETIRDERLADLINECAVMLSKDTLSPMEIRWIVALKSRFAVPEEYIALLASTLNEKGTFTVHRLYLRATSLCKSGIDTVEELEAYFKSVEEKKSLASEIRVAFGIKRNLTKIEREFLKRWSEDFGYSSAIITEAFDSMPTGSSLSFEYLDKILEDWHNAGCKTLEECAKRRDERRKAIAQTYADKPKRSSAKPPKPPTVRYGDFDPEEALRRALARGYAGTKRKTDGEEGN